MPPSPAEVLSEKKKQQFIKTAVDYARKDAQKPEAQRRFVECNSYAVLKIVNEALHSKGFPTVTAATGIRVHLTTAAESRLLELNK
jgi:hypothetical protein